MSEENTNHTATKYIEGPVPESLLFADVENINEKSVIENSKTIRTVQRLNSPLIISVEGIPGIDKELFFNECITPVLSELCMKIIFVKEPSENCVKCQQLALYDTKRWLFSYQLSVLKDKFLLYYKTFELIREGSGTEAVLLEKSLIGDNVYAQTNLELGNLTEIEMEEFNKWQELCNKLFPIKPHISFYLKSDMNILVQKINQEAQLLGSTPNIKFFETLEVMHSVNFKTLSKQNGLISVNNEETKFHTIQNMEYFMLDENIKNKIKEQVKTAILTHNKLADRI